MKKLNDNIEEIVKYRIGRAFETIEEAKLLFDREHWNTAANRVYYSCFYATSAFLAKNNLSHNTHDGAKKLFHLNIIKTGLMGTEWSKFYNRISEKRNEADYEDLIILTKEEIEPLIPQAEEFIAKIKKLIDAE